MITASSLLLEIRGQIMTFARYRIFPDSFLYCTLYKPIFRTEQQQPGTMTVSSAAMSPRDVQTTLNFIEEQADGSHLTPTYVGKPSSYERPITTVPVTIHDASGREQDYTLDSTGFQFHHFPSRVDEIFDANASGDQIKRHYYPEIDRLIKDV